MEYYKFVNMEGWQEHARMLSTWGNKKDVFQRWFIEDHKEELAPLLNWFNQWGLEPNEFFIVRWAESHIEITDVNDPQVCFIHIDKQDSNCKRGVEPIYSLNLPLSNCEQGIIRFYTSDAPLVKYKELDSPGYDPNNSTEVDRFILTQPAILRVNVPHSVENPTKEPRVTACFRFKQDISTCVF